MSKSIDTPATEQDGPLDKITDTIAATTTKVRRAITQYREQTESENPSGDAQLAADIRSDLVFERRLLALDSVASYASEEREGITEAEDGGELHVALDPLDGSSNLEPNSGMGTIFAVYDERPPTSGLNLRAAGYVVYGPTTTMVVARDGRVREYVVEQGRKHLLDANVAMPEEPTVYGFGGGDDSWTDDFAPFANEIRTELKLRYGGAMIADINQVLTYGGMFSYPALKSAPEGKLRLLFEGHPMAYIIESAGGRSSDGTRSLLEKTPADLHSRTPLHLGNASLIERLEAQLA